VKVRVLFNPFSGFRQRRREDLNGLVSVFQKHGLETETVELIEKYQCTVMARQAAEKGYGMVVVIGGDGTVNEAVCGLVNSGVPLGIVPAGSGNGISRALGIPQEPVEACRIIATGHTRKVDVGELNGRFFLGVAGVGYDALVGHLFEEKWGQQRGLWAYFLSALMGYFQYRPHPIELYTGDRLISAVPLLVTVANTTQFGGGAIIAPHARPDDGLFDICIIHHLNLLQALYYWPRLFSGRIDTVPQWEMVRADSLELVSGRPVHVHVDGESLDLSNHVRIRMVPGGLNIRVPHTTVHSDAPPEGFIGQADSAEK
jgi:YegS/Rv2252/BmrU family lipid kinase